MDAIFQLEEAKMKCGIAAWAQLIQLTNGWHLSCNVELPVNDAADFVTCDSDERDINEGMVRRGRAKAVGRPTVLSFVKKAHKAKGKASEQNCEHLSKEFRGNTKRFWLDLLQVRQSVPNRATPAPV